ncbi:hypothetical protein WA158_006162 [Blastocystis sp. Blastoise]
MAPYRILCLHGRYQCAKTFQSKMSLLSHLCSKLPIEFTFMNGPFVDIPPILKKGNRFVHSVPSIRDVEDEYRGWWPGTNRDNFPYIHGTLVNYLELNDIRKFDGIIGFSQGAALASILSSEEMSSELHWQPKMVILFSGNLPKLIYPELYTTNFISDISTLHIYGKQDQVIPFSSANELYEAMKHDIFDCQILAHPSGHIIPVDTLSLNRIVKYIKETIN